MEILAFVLYFAVMLSIGVVMYFKSKLHNNEREYFLGGRKMGPWVTALSAQASDTSAWLLMGLPGSVLAFGLGQAWISIGLCIGTIANWILVARRLRKFSKAAHDSITLPQYFSNRFASKNHALSILCASVFLISFTIYVASAFVAGTTVFLSLFPNMNATLATVIFAVAIVVYTFLGGYKAVCWTDFTQGMLMFFALLSMPIVIIATVDIDFSALNTVYYNATDGTEYRFVANLFAASWQDIVSGMAWGLGYFGMPHIIVRFMSIEKPSMVKKSAIVASVWVVITLLAAIVIAILGRAIVGQELLESGMQKTVFIVLARRYFPSFIAGILLSAIIAASMSTADSQLLVATSAFTNDLYRPLIHKKASDKEMLLVGKLVVVAVALVGFFIARSNGSGAQAIMNMVEHAWGLFGAAFGPVVLLSLFWKRFTYAGALTGVVVGALTDIVWLLTLSASTGVYELLPGFFAGSLASVIASLIDKKPSVEVIAIYNRATDDSIDD